MKNTILLISCIILSSCCYSVKIFKQPDMSKQEYIRDEFGRICIYHGVNISNFTKNSGKPSGYYNRGVADTCWQQPEDFCSLSTWGFNLTRLLWHWEAIEPQKNIFNKEYIHKQIERIKWAANYDIQVVVDIHQDLYTQKFCGNGFPEWTVLNNSILFNGCTDPWNLAYLDKAVLTAYHNFWNNKELQDKYVDMVDSVFKWVDTIPNVLGVDIMNEPFPDMSGKFERKKLTNLYNRIHNMVKEKEYKKLIFFEPWMGTSTGIPTCLKIKGGPGTVYYPHYYDAFIDEKREYKEENKILLKKAIPIKVQESQKFKSPLLYGEFGATPKDLNYLNDLINEFDFYNIGWTYYAHDLPQYSSFTFIDENKNPNAIFSVLHRVYPMKIAGDAPVYYLKDKAFYLSYNKSKASNSTIIYIPPNLNISVETSGEYNIIGNYLYYTNTNEIPQSIKIIY